MRIRVKIAYPLGWVLLAAALAVVDFVVWLLWREEWEAELHSLIMIAIAFVGFKISYELGRMDRKREQVTLRIDKHYRIPGPDAVYTITGLSTWRDMDTHHAEVTFVDQNTWARRRT